MKRIMMSAAAFCALLVAPSIADAAVRGFATANVNMRSGPSTGYPAVTVIPVGAPVTINGCMSSVNWCDVSFVGGRGWVSGRYVQAEYRSDRVYIGPEYYRPLGIPMVTFDVDTYWGRYYRDRDFYRDRDRWRRYSGGDWDRGPDRRPPPPPPPRWERDRDRDRWERDREWDRDRTREEWRDRDRDRDRDRSREEWQRDRERQREDMNRDRDRQREEMNRERERDRERAQQRERERDRDRDRDRARERDRGDALRGSGMVPGARGGLCAANDQRCINGD